MKKIKMIFSLLLFTIFFSFISTPTVVHADMGPKPASYITIKGIEGDYVACFAAQKASGPNMDYERWLEYPDYPKEYNKIMEEKGYEINNIDCLLILEKPKMRPHIDKIRESIASLLHTSIDNVNVKATTNEKLGEIGRGEAIQAHSIVMLRKKVI